MYEMIPTERERMEEPRLMERLMEDPVECPVCPARDGHGPRLYTRKELCLHTQSPRHKTYEEPYNREMN